MGAILGFALGAYGNSVKQKEAKQQQHDDMLRQFYVGHPEVADAPDAQKDIKSLFGEDGSRMLMSVAKLHKQFAGDISGQGGDAGSGPTPPQPGQIAPSPQGSSAPAGGMPSSNPAGGGSPAPQAQASSNYNDVDAGIAYHTKRIADLSALHAKYPDQKEAIDGAIGGEKEALTTLRQEKAQKVGEDKQQAGFEQQNKIESQRIGEQNKTIAAMGDRLTRSEAFQNDMQTRREQQQNHLQDLKDAKTGEDRKLKMKQIVASLGKTTADLTAKLGKGSDYDQQQREMSAQSHNEYIDSLVMMADDPEQAAALQKNKINVGAATSTWGGLGSKPGAVGGEALPPPPAGFKVAGP